MIGVIGMPIKIKQKKVEYYTVELADEDAKEVTVEYLSKVILGDGCYVTKKGVLEHWTGSPHGSGTTTDMGKATELQGAAQILLKLLKV